MLTDWIKDTFLAKYTKDPLVVSGDTIIVNVSKKYDIEIKYAVRITAKEKGEK